MTNGSHNNLPLSLLLGLAALLATLLPLVLCCVRLRDRRGALGLANGPEFQESRCFTAAVWVADAGSFKVLMGTTKIRQFSDLPMRSDGPSNLDVVAENWL